ncbi:hypothetical protein TARUN_6482 [Trichoderma arundinaceum]|uniref:Uncharacterized protein n=1 Tax=Trichoderma arundinaceum TaxID=490622 RepID=A0A395NIT8_TRIAR|nr:hypothetical protein TARUN_6482 [Trichoderma arundinaceum]
MSDEEETRRWLEEVVTRSGLITADDPKLVIARRLDIIPLRDGTQTSLTAGPVFWPTSAGAHIPADIAVRLLEMLGVREAPVKEIRSLILQKHHDVGKITPVACKEHLRFLYLTHGCRSTDVELRDVYVVDHELQLVRPCVEDVYLPGRAPFSPEYLFSQLAVADPEDLSYSTSFVNAVLLEDAPSPPPMATTYPTWTRWLCDSLGVLEQIRLLNRKGNDISDEFAQIAHQRPDLVLGILEHIWKTQGQVVSDKPEIMSKIKRISVPCRTGDLRPLWETYIPFQHLQRRCLEFMKSSEPFPFLDFGFQPSTEDLSGRWSFLYRDLGVSKNDDLGLLLDILSYIQEANPNGLSSKRCHEIVGLYCELEALCADSDEPDSSRDICRQAFEQERLIAVYIDGRLDWVKRSQCLWSSPVNIAGRVALDDCYAGMENFFVNKLGIGRLTAGIVYDKLLEIGLETPPISEVGDTLELFSSLLRESQEQLDPGPLLRRRLFPVKCLDNVSRLVSAEIDFAIGDRQHLVEPFTGRAKMLDFDLGEVSRLKPFFKWAGLERRYLSTLVTETTFVAGGLTRPISDVNRDIKRKAHALLRITAAFSGRLQSQTDAFNLYKRLRNIEVIETSGILSVHTLIQDGKVVTSRATRSMLHMDDETGHLAIYVPDDKKAQDVCFATVLPERLAEWLMGDPTLTKIDAIMVAIVGSVLHYEVSIADQILQRQGIGYTDLLGEGLGLNLIEQGQAANDDSGSAGSLNNPFPLQSPPLSEPNLRSPFLGREGGFENLHVDD